MKLGIYLFDQWIKVEVANRHEQFLKTQVNNQSFAGTLLTNHITGVMDIDTALDNLKKFTSEYVTEGE